MRSVACSADGNVLLNEDWEAKFPGENDAEIVVVIISGIVVPDVPAIRIEVTHVHTVAVRIGLVPRLSVSPERPSIPRSCMF